MNIVWEFEHAVECNANRTFAWSFWTDVSNWQRIEGEAVDEIVLDGPFEVGTHGQTKAPGQEPRNWRISEINSSAVHSPEVDSPQSATIEMPIDQCLFLSRMVFESLSDGRTRITQHLSLQGEVPDEMLAGIRTFEQSAPQGLARLAEAIAEACVAQQHTSG